MTTAAERRKQRLERFIGLYCAPGSAELKDRLVYAWHLIRPWWECRHQGNLLVTVVAQLAPPREERKRIARHVRFVFCKEARKLLGSKEPMPSDFWIIFQN